MVKQIGWIYSKRQRNLSFFSARKCLLYSNFMIIYRYENFDLEVLKMKVILLDNIKGVGRKDDVIEANDGYARNFLIPKKLAIPANAENMSKLKGKQDSKAHQKDVDKKAAEEMKEKLSKIILKIKVKFLI